METAFALFVIFAAPVNVDANAPVTLAPITSFTVSGEASSMETAERRALTACNRFVRAAAQANMVGSCSIADGPQEVTAAVTGLNPA